MWARVAIRRPGGSGEVEASAELRCYCRRSTPTIALIGDISPPTRGGEYAFSRQALREVESCEEEQALQSGARYLGRSLLPPGHPALLLAYLLLGR